MNEPTTLPELFQIVRDLRQDLLETRREVTVLRSTVALLEAQSPPPGWAAIPTWYAPDGSGRAICLNPREGTFNYTTGERGPGGMVTWTTLPPGIDARKACSLADAARKPR